MRGIPDVHWWTTEGFSGWVELKTLFSKSGKISISNLRIEQAIWMNTYAKTGGNVCVLAGFVERNNSLFCIIRGNYRLLLEHTVPESMIVWRGTEIDKAACSVIVENVGGQAVGSAQEKTG